MQHNIATIVLGGDLEADLVENAPAPETTARGTLVILNDGAGVTAFLTAQTGTPGRYGAFSVDAAGAWTYTLDNARPGLADLNDGQRFIEIFHVEARTSLSALAGTIVFGEVRITIIGTTDGGGANEPAWFGGELAGTLTEDDATVGGALLIINPDGLNRVEAATATAGDYGAFTITAAGVWNYDLNNELPAIQGLFTAEFKTDTFTVTAADDGDTPATMALTVTITGVNDAAVFGAQPPVIIDEDAGQVSGMIMAGDADGGDMVVAGTTDGALGAFTITADGAWTYTLTAVAQELVTGDSETERFTVTAADDGDDPATVEVAITVTGVSDPAVFGGDTTGEIGEDATAPLAGTLTISNADGADTVVAQTGTPGDYGVFSIDELGAWTYTLGDAAQTLRRDQSPVERFTVTAADDGDTPTTVDVAITVNGANDEPAPRIITPSTPEQIFPSGIALPVAGEHGDVDIGDPVTYQWTTRPPGGGSFADANAASTIWTAPVITRDTVQFDLRLEVSDDGGTNRRSVGIRVFIRGAVSDITVTGPCLDNTGDSRCRIAEDAASNVLRGTAGFSGDSAEPDDGFAFTASPPEGVAVTYGTYFLNQRVITTLGTRRVAADWMYTLDNANPQVDALDDGDTLTEAIPVLAQVPVNPGGGGGTLTIRGTITLTIAGANDPPTAVIQLPAPDVTVAHGETLMVRGTGADPDGDDPAESLRYRWSTTPADRGSFSAVTAETAETTWTPLGFIMDSDVMLNLRVSDDQNAASTASVAVSVTVPDTAPSFGDAVIGDLTFTTGAAITPHLLPAASGGNGGSSYRIRPALPRGLSFDAGARTLRGQPATPSGPGDFIYTAADEDSNRSPADEATLDFTITIVEPPLTFAGDATGGVTEDGAPAALETGGTLTITNPRTGGTDFVTQTERAYTYGRFSIDAAGVWTYALDNADPQTHALAAGATGDETITVAAAADAAFTHDIAITVTGANDPPTAAITSPAAGTRVEFGAPTRVTGAGSDPDTGDTAALTYAWSTEPPNRGSFDDPALAAPQWFAPDSAGAVTLVLEVSDRSDTATARVAGITPVAVVVNISGIATGDVTEDGAPAETRTGNTLTITSTRADTTFRGADRRAGHLRPLQHHPRRRVELPTG